MDIFIALLTVATVVMGLAIAYILGYRHGLKGMSEETIREIQQILGELKEAQK